LCIIALCTEKKLTPIQIWYCWTNNPDGAGIAWTDGSKHFYSKGYMTYNEFIEAYKVMDGIFPHVVHFRTASSGDVIPSLTHPFVCSKKVPLNVEWEGKEPLLFHNGIISGWEMMARLFKIDPDNPYWSDTRLLSLILSQYSYEEIIKPELTGRFVILRDGEFFPHGKFEIEDGIIFSNTGYKENLYEYYYVVTTKGDKQKYRRKKRRNIRHNGNVASKGSSKIYSGNGGDYSQSGIQQDTWAGNQESCP
jgi:predicted glutamine amidotransferase